MDDEEFDPDLIEDESLIDDGDDDDMDEETLNRHGFHEERETDF